MKTKLLALMMGTSLVLAACGGASDNKGGGNDTASGGDAEKIFSQKCSTCHGGNLEGGMGPKLADVGSRLTKDQIKNKIEHGGGGMPEGLLKGAELDKVADWLSKKK
ncbi:cytochrome c [Neobacillus sp. PS3-34]|uniref:cytochrome c551 n=1 Tax=Neobacillus sp. PS3-34 TaxID=3070678 RepID=UPI0027E0DF04|nr:cytochrome c [Neobacillus sp. PS3-34]WML46928.1 cytochrome c [Neobacillus sp. PS3-34]